MSQTTGMRLTRARIATCDAGPVLAVARKNVELTLANIREDSPVLAELASNGTIKITGAIYNLETGDVEFFV
jgi:carbonic anhydrase